MDILNYIIAMNKVKNSSGSSSEIVDVTPELNEDNVLIFIQSKTPVVEEDGILVF